MIVGEVIQFRRKRPASGKKMGLCQHGFHKWSIWKDKQFDVKQGRLVTVLRCERCGIEKTELR